MSENATEKEKLAMVEKVNAVFLGTRDFRALAERAVRLMAQELEREGVLGVAAFRIHPEENKLQAYAYSSRSFDAVAKLFPTKFSNLSVSLGDPDNLLVKAVRTREPQESDSLYAFSRPTLPESVCAAVQKTIGFGSAVAYPLRLKRGKAAGALLFAIEGKSVNEHQRALLEAFRSQLELAFENVLEFERVVERYKRSAAKVRPEEHADMPTVHFTLRISPRQNAALEKKAKEEGTDKTSLIRSWLDTFR